MGVLGSRAAATSTFSEWCLAPDFFVPLPFSFQLFVLGYRVMDSLLKVLVVELAFLV